MNGGGTSIEALLTAEGYLEGGAAGVRGRICVANVGDWPTEGLALHDVVEYKTGGGPFVALPGAELIIAPELPLPAGEHACSDYQIPFKPVPDAQYRNTVRVTILNHAGWMPGGPHCAGSAPCPFGPEPKADFELAAVPVNESELATDLPAPELTAPPHPTVRRATDTPPPTGTVTPSLEPTATATESPTATPTHTHTPTPSPTPTPVPTETDTPPSPSPVPTATPELPPTKTSIPPPTKTPILPPTKTPLPS